MLELGVRPGLTIPVPDFATAADGAPPDDNTEPDGAVAPENPESTVPSSESGPRLGHLTGLDGLRAIAVLAVLVYHSGLDWLPGGFLGVEVFFVISGYLITGLLLTEWKSRGRIDLKAFWIRRARRLLPALFVVLAATLGYALIWLPEELARLRFDALAAVGYVTNWYLVLGQQSYFAGLERQSPLLHLWSLAVEEQFYVLWPIVLAGGLWLIGRRLFFAVTVAGAVASAVWMAILYQPEADVSRIYYGTDTRLTGLLLGSALAFVWLPRPGRSTWLPAEGRWLPVIRLLLDGATIAGLAAIGWFLFAVDESDPFLFRGGLALLAAVTGLTIAAAVHPAGRAGRLLLDWLPLRWLGTRSYSVYLWHWPVFMITRPGLDIPVEPIAAFGVRLFVTATLAELSYRFVETRFRYSRFAQPAEPRPVRPALRAKLAWAVAIAALATVLAGPIATASPPSRPGFLPADSIDGLVAVDTSQGAGGIEADEDDASASRDTAPTGAQESQPPDATAGQEPPARRMLFVGDSVVLAVYKAVARKIGPVTVDAAIGRSVGEGVRVLRDRRSADTLGDVVIVDLGNNGRLTPGLFDEAMKALASVQLVVWVNLSVPRGWEGPNNRAIAVGVREYPNTRLADWHSVSNGRPELFWDDGYHPRGRGATLYARLIADAIR